MGSSKTDPNTCGKSLYLKMALNISGGRKSYVIDCLRSNDKLFVKMQMWIFIPFLIPDTL